MPRRALKTALALCLALILVQCATLRGTRFAPAPAGPFHEETMRVLTYNILKGGCELGQPLAQTARVITASGADAVIFQEIADSGPALARMLGWNLHRVNDSVAIASRFPITQRSRHGCALRLPSGRIVWVFGVHLTAYPYGPYDLRDNPALRPEALIQTARNTRESEISPVLNALIAARQAGYPVILGGDFNEPSHLDWTPRAAAAGMHFGLAVAWPTAAAVVRGGCTDSFRALRPDEVRDPAETWTPLVAENEVHDRIDRLYHAGPGIAPVDAAVIGEHAGRADIVIQPYPSDHRAVAITYRLAAQG